MNSCGGRVGGDVIDVTVPGAPATTGEAEKALEKRDIFISIRVKFDHFLRF